ncbi:E3 binding domain-containing protein [Mesorhizobium sp.]|uniref:E3 binding domain-containing protein n=1 Tax=Mesorhizobium sp. TaxID=1871066 RepID=UPI003563DC21
MAVGQTRRPAVSPYARRLARERGLPLETLHGSGPDGRILAADVLGFVPVVAPANAPEVAAAVAIPIAAPPVAAPRIAAFATSLSLGALGDLLAALASTGKTFDIDDILLRAVDRAFAENPHKSFDAPVALELVGRQMVLATDPEMPMTLLRATRLAALASDRDDAEKAAVLSLRVLPAGDIRPMMMPLLQGRAMRLAVSVNMAGDHADCLLTTDAASVDEATAIAWFASLKSAIENPLRLFV